MDKDSILRAAELMAEQIDYPGIQPCPVPTSVKLFQEDDFAVFVFTTPIGENTYYLDLESADKLADGLKKIVNQ